MSLLLFLTNVLVISLSGVLAPGPVTAAAIGMGARNRFAGVLMALGHGVVEFPLMVLLIFGVGRLLTQPAVSAAIGLVGGGFLILMGVQMLQGLGHIEVQAGPATRSGPLTTGILLSAGNPYFLIWWATVGLTLITTAQGFGLWAFVLFALTHWLCDLVWLTILSWASFKGSAILGPGRQRIVLAVCALVMVGFGLYFIARQVATLMGRA
ncbi:MAG: LysE family translocator [Planctomycetes bacterium]|jgi:threonine/homoserine/homoserine lactone efflux protein|nr:LysE family translocator [Planctomycetota bacterium]